MKSSKQDELKLIAFASSQGFEKWLADNHANAGGLWIRIFKKDSGVKTISHNEALDEALCYGCPESAFQEQESESLFRHAEQNQLIFNYLAPSNRQ